MNNQEPDSKPETVEEPRDEGLSSTALFACPDCGAKLYEDEADEGPEWYECEKCDFSCDSDYDRETGEIFPDFKANAESIHPESKPADHE